MAEGRGGSASATGGGAPEDADTAVRTEQAGARLAQELREGRAPPTLAAVLVAWAVTLAPAGFGRGSTLLTTVLCVAALAAGLAGPLLARARPQSPRLARHLGISLFAALATATWLAGRYSIEPIRLDPIRGTLGAVAWGVFALSWSERWSARSEPEPVDPDAPLLLPRAALPPLSTSIAALGVAFALGYVALAFRAREPDRALVAQAAALACGVAVVVGAGIVATARSKPRPEGGRRLTPRVVRALLLLATTAIAGAVITALR
jgi:hypothetical protein